MTRDYNLPNIRDLLAEFDDEELRRLCYDERGFKWVYDQLARKGNKAEVINHLVEYAERKELIDTLLTWMEKNNPAKYKEPVGPYQQSTPSTGSKSYSIPKEETQEDTQLSALTADFVIVTALEEERDAVLAKLPGYQRLTPSEDDVRSYFLSHLPVTFPDGSTGTYCVVVMPLLGMGRVQATIATSDAIRRWQPRYVMLVGIAGGVAAKKVKLGDILISDQIVDYELQKLTPEEAQIRWEVHRADPRLVGAAGNLTGDSWQKLITTKRPNRRVPKRHIGPIASGDKVIAFSEVLEKYYQTWSKLIGVEMEAGGVATASFQAARPPGFFMVRGVSDLANENKGSDEVERWRLYACDVAASYVITLLQNGPVPLVASENWHASVETTKAPTPPTRDEIVLYEPALCLWEDGVCTKRFSLRQEATHLIGRAGVCQFQIPNKYDTVSRRHARIKRIENKAIILDGDGASSSRYGTFVNGIPVDDELGVILRDSDQIVLGGFKDNETQLIADKACLLTFEGQLLTGVQPLLNNR